MKIELEVKILPGNAPLTVSDLAGRIPGLELGVSEVLERSEVSFGGRITVEDDEDGCEREVARYLAALRRLSIELPGAVITIAELPDGGILRLENGSFGADDDEVAAVLATHAGERRSTIYVAFRIEEDAHAHLLQLVTRSVPRSTPTVDSSPRALAIGFVIDGTERVADLIGALRLAWRQEGTECECLVEIEGDHPVVTVVRTWAEWVELERQVRRSSIATEATASSEAEPKTVELADVRETRRVLGDWELSWIDADDQILCIHDGKMVSLSERSEDGKRATGEVRRRDNDSVVYARGDRCVDVPPPASGAERRLHGVDASGALFSDSTGDGDAARTELLLVHGKGVERGPTLSCVRAIAAGSTEIYALARGRRGPALLSIEIGRGWGYAETTPWHPEDTPTDVAVISTGRIAITASRDSRSVLYLVERANLTHSRRLALPCLAPQIVAHGPGTVWLTGMSPSTGPKRCDLFHVDQRRGTVTVVTAELADVPAIDVAASDDGARIVLATPRVAFQVSATSPLQEIVELGGDETITAMACGPTTSAVFIRGTRGSRLVLGRREVTVPLKAPGYVARLALRG